MYIIAPSLYILRLRCLLRCIFARDEIRRRLQAIELSGREDGA